LKNVLRLGVTLHRMAGEQVAAPGAAEAGAAAISPAAPIAPKAPAAAVIITRFMDLLVPAE
jgi:hypothetical protein